MQVIVIRYPEGTPLDYDEAFEFAKNLHETKHGGIVLVPDHVKFEIIEIEGDELPVVLGTANDKSLYGVA